MSGEEEVELEETTEEIIEEEIDKKVFTAKDPKKVEQGKRLAAISKAAKEKNMRERIRQEDFSYLPWISYAVSIFSTIAIIYLLYPHSKKEDPIVEQPAVEQPVKQKKNFVSF